VDLLALLGECDGSADKTGVMLPAGHVSDKTNSAHNLKAASRAVSRLNHITVIQRKSVSGRYRSSRIRTGIRSSQR
jgi:hypothetical protein